MGTKRARISRKPAQKLSPMAVYIMGDEVLYPPPGSPSLAKWRLASPTEHWDECRKLWQAGGELVVMDWIARYPGSRPSWWWYFSAPRMSQDEIARRGWGGVTQTEHLCDLRQRIGGTGIPDYEAPDLRILPRLRCGIPVRHFGVDPADPPQYESQASYLRRHGLLTADEAARLTRRDFAPETISVAD